VKGAGMKEQPDDPAVPAVERIGPSEPDRMAEIRQRAANYSAVYGNDTVTRARYLYDVNYLLARIEALSAPPVGEIERLIAQWRNEFDAQDVTTPFEHGVRAGLLRCADELAALAGRARPTSETPEA
jgi:hypothetical protein